MTLRRLLTIMAPSIGAAMIGRGVTGIITTGNTLAYSLLATAGTILYVVFTVIFFRAYLRNNNN